MDQDIGWDKRLVQELKILGLDREKMGYIIGIIAEQRQIADRQGYIRGYNNGYAHAESKLTESKS